MMFIVTHLNFIHTPKSLGMVLSQLFGNRIEIRNVMKNQEDLKCPNKSSQYFAQNYFCVSITSKLRFRDTFYIYPLLPRGSMALVGLGLQYEVPRSHSDNPHSVGHPKRAIGPSQSPLTDNTQHSQHSQETGT
jgi:hypothetical protein